ncbi:hypothetical protein [Frigoriglobus tundricola]|uniref:Uncharacterized protein n=1 Tax=Frigoriglobus tundricola TaxID=2774151 RepID=A0A6M5Z475_9BACT|nr:hypothetical protein [Frigoriglobus tundricola]QJX00577.1 hypothetical protein FTUN_8209 [Frigoriglobus tundricola]
MALAELPIPPTLRVADSHGRVACLIQVWDAAAAMPTAGSERRRLSRTGRGRCRGDIVEVVRAAGRALTAREVVQGLLTAGKGHGPGTVARALADLMVAGELVNPKDKKGYRLAEWRKRTATRSLFD